MTSEQIRLLIAEQLRTIADDIEKLPDNPTQMQVTVLINEQYQVMRQLSAYVEHRKND